MGEPLKTFFSESLVRDLAETWRAVGIDVDGLVDEVVPGLAERELLDRGRHIAAALRRRLPEDPEAALRLVVRTLGAEHATDELIGVGMAPFRYQPATEIIGQLGPLAPEAGWMACEAVTKRFSAESCLRPILDAWPEQGAKALDRWVVDPNPHVRRLVSEGTRPLLPWAPRLRAAPWTFLPWLECLKMDPAELVRRSVANHLNDLGRNDADRLVAVATRWREDGVAPRLLSHALRGAVRRGHRGALAFLGAVGTPLATAALEVTPVVAWGGSAAWLATVMASAAGRVVVDVAMVGPGGGRRVYKGSVVDAKPGVPWEVRGTIGFQPMTTRRHVAGEHQLDLVVDGEVRATTSFVLAPSVGGWVAACTSCAPRPNRSPTRSNTTGSSGRRWSTCRSTSTSTRRTSSELAKRPEVSRPNPAQAHPRRSNPLGAPQTRRRGRRLPAGSGRRTPQTSLR